MANYKIINDNELGIPVAVPSYVAGELITDTFNKRNNGPTTQPSAASQVITSSDNKDIKMSVVDVVKDYDWKVSPNNNIVEHPYIILQEYRVHRSPLLAQLSYLAKAGAESLGAGFKASTAVITPEGSENKALKAIEGMLKYIGEGANILASKATEVISDIEKDVGAVEEDLEGDLKPFQGLYYLKKTNFSYRLPYFSNKMIERTASWQENFAGTSKLAQLVQDGLNAVATTGAGVPILGAFAEPGIYIERGKYFNPVPRLDPVRIKFPLLNTLTPESIQQNFNLIWLLLFQNSSIRRNKTDVFPPCIYRVLIPGVRFMLYATAEISVDYIGTRRRLPIIHPATGETINTTIPEAYDVEIIIESLTTECGNFLLKSLSNVL